MSLEEGQKLYQLKKPLSFKHKGETIKATFLELREPKMSHSRAYNKIDQIVSGLTTQSALKFHQMGLDKDTVISGTEVKSLSEIDSDEYEDEAEKFGSMLGACFGFAEDPNLLANFVDTFAKMACNSTQSSVCVVGGEVPMSSAIWQEMSPIDGKGAAIAWASFFTMPAELADDKESGSASE